MPRGVKTSVWSLVRFQWPATASFGSAAEDLLDRRGEREAQLVARIEPAAGRRGHERDGPLGRREVVDRRRPGPSCSHGRAATATLTVPAFAFSGSLSDVPVPRAVWPA